MSLQSMDDPNSSVNDIKLRIYQKILYLGGTIPYVIWLLDYKSPNTNVVNSIFLPLVSIFCLASLIFFRRRGVAYMKTFETGIYATTYLYMVLFLLNTSYRSLSTGIFTIQKFLLWLPMIHITSFMVFSKTTALRLSLSFTAIVSAIGGSFLFLTRSSPFLLENFQVLFEILAANVIYMFILYVIVLLKDVIHRGEIRAALISELAYTDPLTGIFNRRKINEVLKYYEANKIQYSVIMIDIDHFKNINDTFGHEQGDRFLNEVAGLLRSNLRTHDMVGRWGGDEFILVCLNASGVNGESIQNRMERLNDNSRLKAAGCSLSFGIATSERGESFNAILRRADENLYRHKRMKNPHAYEIYDPQAHFPDSI